MICDYCNEKIEIGEDYILFDGGVYHEDCFRENTYEILEDNGAKMIHYTRGEEERDWDAEIDERLYERIS